MFLYSKSKAVPLHAMEALGGRKHNNQFFSKNHKKSYEDGGGVNPTRAVLPDTVGSALHDIYITVTNIVREIEL
jgi:hypothetical protein